MLVELPGRPSRSGRRCGATGEKVLTSWRGEAKRVPPMVRGRPRDSQGSSQIHASGLLVSDGPRAAGCAGVRKEGLMLGRCQRREESELGRGTDTEFQLDTYKLGNLHSLCFHQKTENSAGLAGML